MLKVRDVLKMKGNDIWSIGPDETVYKALEIMADKDIGALLVIDKGRVVGIFSERDYARKVSLKGKSSRETTVGELMTREVYSITSDRSVEECMALMTTAHCRHMPVYENNQLAGIVTIGNVVNTIIAEQKIAISDLENYIKGSGYVDASNKP
jgi:CBS domain-containing protein